MSKFLILGDTHCGSGLSIGKQAVGSALNSRIIDQNNLLDWTLDQAIDRDVSDIVITGDIFDDPKPPIPVIKMFIDWLQKCSCENKHVHIIYGNHDFLRSGQFYTSPLELISSADIENVSVYNRINTVHWNDISITFLPFRDRRSFNTDSNAEAVDRVARQLPYELSSIMLASKKVLIGHLALEGSIPMGNELDDAQNELMCPLHIFKGYDCVVMGHIHKHQVMQENPHISHIGSMDISNFGEEDQKKYIGVIDSKNEIEYIEIPTRPLKHIIIDIPDKADAMEYIESFLSKEKGLNKSISKVSIKMAGSRSSSIDRKKIESILAEKGAYHTVKIAEEKRAESVKKENAPKFDNTVNEFSAIKIYSEAIADESIRNEFVKIASDIVKDYNNGSN